MPRGPCLHILWSMPRLIFPSFLSRRLSSGDCCTSSHGFLVGAEELGCGRIGTVCCLGIGVPFSRCSVVVDVVPFEGPFCCVCSWYPIKSLSPCLQISGAWVIQSLEANITFDTYFRPTCWSETPCRPCSSLSSPPVPIGLFERAMDEGSTFDGRCSRI